MDVRAPDGARYYRILSRQTVIISRAREGDGRIWTHLSTALPKRLPHWDELVTAKELFMGAETKAIQVLAPRSEWPESAGVGKPGEFVLHLFACEEADPLPDFRGIDGTL